MESHTEMDLYSSSVSSPTCSPRPEIQEPSNCSRRLQNTNQIQKIRIYIERKSSAIKTYQSYKDFNENEPYYIAEVNAYLKAQANTKELVSLLHSIPSCEFNGCPLPQKIFIMKITLP
ncbi:hypothetical protein NPIL_652871 [Nephila pilipes]|uniref:Uncharacterized protein n=1 Tax=Nephila pilipes TaxID=299642 RepID=A0A8X6NWD1_NEPPI|nr:hypothetical protein NPIL_652871 [Nephila pilipes]